MKILLLTHPMPPEPFAAAIRALAPQHELLAFHPGIDPAALSGVEVVLGWQMPRGLPGRMPKLRWVCAVAAGVDKLLVEDLPAAVPVSRIVDVDQAEGIAQFVVLMALRHARALPMYEVQQRERRWRRQPVAAVRSRVAVLGTGAMGGVVLELLRTVGFEARGWSRRSREPLESLLAESDIVVCALPLTAQTRDMLDARAFAAMPAGSYLINIARGGHVVEADLIAALDSGRLAHAVLDVYASEPLAATHPFWTQPGITVLPHVAAQTDPRSAAQIAARIVRALRAGTPLAHLVDRRRGY